MARGWEAFRALRYRDFFWFWSSYFVSNVGIVDAERGAAV